jgi:hypothetical protein
VNQRIKDSFNNFRHEGAKASHALRMARSLNTAHELGLKISWEWDDHIHWADWESIEDHMRYCSEARHLRHKGNTRRSCEHTYEGCVVKLGREILASCWGIQDRSIGSSYRDIEADVAGHAIEVLASRYAENPPVTYAIGAQS